MSDANEKVDYAKERKKVKEKRRSVFIMAKEKNKIKIKQFPLGRNTIKHTKKTQHKYNGLYTAFYFPLLVNTLLIVI